MYLVWNALLGGGLNLEPRAANRSRNRAKVCVVATEDFTTLTPRMPVEFETLALLCAGGPEDNDMKHQDSVNQAPATPGVA